MSSINLIKNANTARTSRLISESNIRSTLTEMAEKQDMTAIQLSESVTHILANISATALEGTPLKLMHLNSIAAFMAGVEAIANALPKATDQGKVITTLRTLQAAKVGADGFVSGSVGPIAEYGARKEDLMAKYSQMIKDYTLSADRGQADGQQLSQAARQLQTTIDQAMRSASASANQTTPV